MDTKSWYTSKTLWANIGIIITTLGTLLTGQMNITTAEPIITTAIVNMVLRFMTKKGLE